MLEQREFWDAHGTRWLNRPGPPAGPSLTQLGLIVCAPLLICLGGTVNAYVLGGGSSFVLLIVALVSYAQSAITQAGLQTCPRCHYTRKRGYVRCRCGYPER